MTTSIQSHSMNECPICFEAITEATGHAVLGCSHKFHLMCVVRWFQEQDSPSSCPFCRHEVGTLDNVPIYPEGSDDDEENEDDDNDDDDDDDDESDNNSVGSIRRVWTRDQRGGQWEGRWVLYRPVVTIWDPTASQDDDIAEPPNELIEIATNIQRIWRGYRIRKHSPPQPSTITRLIPETDVEAEAVQGLLMLSAAPLSAAPTMDWFMTRMTRVT